jgi:aspartyl-tRNA(Asn)/glutamyl-tRNA(Gln) amidotransferase subunit C
MISKENVQQVSHLARLRLTEDELQLLAEQLSSVLDHFQEIVKVDTKGVVPLVTASDIAMYLREDKVERVSDTEKLMQNAPEKSGHLFKVPPVV